MIPRRTFLSLSLRSLVMLTPVILATTASAKKKKRRGTRIVKGKASELPRVTQADGWSMTVGGKYYEVPEDAEVIVNGKKASMKQVKVGMQAMVTGKVLTYGPNKKETVYQATRVVARSENHLAKKAAAHNKKARARNNGGHKRRR